MDDKELMFAISKLEQRMFKYAFSGFLIGFLIFIPWHYKEIRKIKQKQVELSIK